MLPEPSGTFSSVKPSSCCGSCGLGGTKRTKKQSLGALLALPPTQVQPADSLEPEFSRKCQALLKRWREKVFALMVQLKAQELEHRGCVAQLKGQVT